MYDNGADIVYHAAGGSGTGVFEAAKAAEQAGPSASTPTSTRRPTRRSEAVILTSMLKRVDVAVVRLHQARSTTATSPAGSNVFDLKDDGVGYSTSGGQIDDIIGRSSTSYKQQIIAGEITVPDTP